MPICECPHCHSRVFSTNGACPACQKRLDAPGDTPHLTYVTLYDDLPVPPLCVSCGEATEREEIAGSKYTGELDDALAMAGSLSGHVDARSARIRQQARLRLRRCDACARRHGALKLDAVDDAEGRIRLLVHRRFAEALERKR